MWLCIQEFQNKQTIHKLNECKRLLKSSRIAHSIIKQERIKALNKEIKLHYHSLKSHNVRRSIFPGNTASLWQSVKIAKDINISTLPQTLYQNNIPLDKEGLPDEVASFLHNKITKLADEINTW